MRAGAAETAVQVADGMASAIAEPPASDSNAADNNTNFMRIPLRAARIRACPSSNAKNAFSVSAFFWPDVAQPP